MARSLSRSRWLGLALAGLVGAVAVVFACVMAFDAFFYRHLVVPSYAMEPAVPHGSSVWTRPASAADINRGEIVLLRPPAGHAAPSTVIDRVVAVGGDTVEARDGHLLVDGTAANEPYLAPGMITPPLPNTSVPAGTVYVLGDNRVNSQGSRYFGPVPLGNITLRVVRAHAPSDKTLLLLGGGALAVLGICIFAVVRIVAQRR